MEDQHKRDALIRKLVGKKGAETPPADFTDKLMARIKTETRADDSPLLSKGSWVAIFLAAAAVIIFILVVDIPVFQQLFSASGIQKVSMNVFSGDLLSSLSSLFDGLKVSGITLAIIVAAAGLFLLERILHRRLSDAGMCLINLFI